MSLLSTDRRGFLRGFFGGVAAAGAGLIVKATPQEVQAFAAPLVQDAPLMLDQPAREPATFGAHLYNSKGQVVALVRSVNAA